ncbi:MAG: hypothetical protein FWD61_05490 [Phycisphaerales bacterium]|nr:hypothetical protein [Phycisphaerales bacterium]
MNKKIVSFVNFCWAVLLTAVLGGCDVGLTDVGFANDMVEQQELSRVNRGIPSATELPPGIGEDLPAPPAADTQPSSTNP